MSIYIFGDIRCGVNGYKTMILMQDGSVTDKDGNTIGKAVEVPPHGALKDMEDLDRAFTVLRFNEDGSLKHWGNRKDWCVRGAEVEMLFATAPTIIPEDPPTPEDLRKERTP